MEAKLREYRALRRRQQLINNAKEKLHSSKDKFVDFITPKFLKDMGKEKEEEVLLMESEDSSVTPEVTDQPDDTSVCEETSNSVVEANPESWRYFIIKWTIYCLIWLTLFMIFLKLQFGAVFFVISALIGICVNTRTRPKKSGEVSAYSVFNQNCVSIDGTLKAEQFEREILYGAGSVR